MCVCEDVKEDKKARRRGRGGAKERERGGGGGKGGGGGEGGGGGGGGRVIIPLDAGLTVLPVTVGRRRFSHTHKSEPTCTYMRK